MYFGVITKNKSLISQSMIWMNIPEIVQKCNTRESADGYFRVDLAGGELLVCNIKFCIVLCSKNFPKYIKTVLCSENNHNGTQFKKSRNRL